MSKRTILHMFDPTPNNSPFDVNMALDAGFDVLMPYSGVKLENIQRLTQDVIFSRGPAGVKKTAIFIGGRDIGLAVEMLEACRPSMVKPFEVSVLADPSGAFTTAAALVACVEKSLFEQYGKPLTGCKALVFGGTGPVGIATGVIASLQGAETYLVDHLTLETADDIAKQYNRRFGSSLKAAVARTDEDKMALISDADIVFSTAKAGVRVLNAAVLASANQLKVVGDVNAVPPSGIEGVSVKDFSVSLLTATNSKAFSVGALAIGNVKYQLQQTLLKTLLESQEPVFLDFRQAFVKARQLV